MIRFTRPTRNNDKVDQLSKSLSSLFIRGVKFAWNMSDKDAVIKMPK